MVHLWQHQNAHFCPSGKIGVVLCFQKYQSEVKELAQANQFRHHCFSQVSNEQFHEHHSKQRRPKTQAKEQEDLRDHFY